MNENVTSENVHNSPKVMISAAQFVSGLALSGDDAAIVARHLDAVLMAPVRELMGRPHKSIRAQLVTAGYHLGHEILLARGEGAKSSADSVALGNVAQKQTSLEQIGLAVELLHGGSLIVDDVQDRSLHRRGGPTIHRMFGEANAIAAGNWLYFHPFEIIRSLPIGRALADRMCAAFESNVARAHYGQALDVGIKADVVVQSEVEPLSRSIMDFKTGSLTALGLTLGGQFAGLPEKDCDALSECGRGVGVALQMFDDVGNLTSRKDPEKSLEDLTNRRLSWVWGFAASSLSRDDYATPRGRW